MSVGRARLPTLVCLLSVGLGPSAAWADCNRITGVEELLHPGAVVLLGEVHGTAEAPGAVEDLVCAAHDAGLAVAVGLEIPVSEEAAMRRFLRSDGAPADLSAATAGDFWQRDYQDGRASQAMQDLHAALAKHPARPYVFYIDDPTAPAGRDRFMASRVAEIAEQRPDTLVIVLTGNIHSRLIVGTRFDAGFEPMGFHVRNLIPDREVVSLRVTYDGGTAWVCAPECGVRELDGQPGAPGIALEPSDDGAYSGRLHVGRIHASLPAKDR